MTNSPVDGLAAKPRPELRAVESLARPETAETTAGAPEPAPEAPASPASPRKPAKRAAPRRIVSRKTAAKRRRVPAPVEDDDDLPETLPEPAPGAAVQHAPEVRAAAMRPRHWLALASFLLLVVLPFAGSAWYLYARAADQYHSNVAFSIRSEEMGSATAGLIGALTQINSGTASDPDILFEYIRSQKIVEEIDAELDLRRIYNRDPEDVVFSLGDDPSIEALQRQWLRMVDVSYESSSGIIHVRANAFDPEDAQAIAAHILAHSDRLVNELSGQARTDAIRLARSELEEAEVNLRGVRDRLADFRRTHNIVDPQADVAGQMGLLNALQQELAQALVDRDVILSSSSESDQRVIQANRRIKAITARIEEERSSLDLTGVAGSLPEVVGTYEELLVDLEFANTAYTQTLGGLAGARAEARRQSRYLAAHVEPTVAQSALYPRRLLLSGLVGLFLMLGWGIAMLVYYNVRDNR